MAHQCNWGAWAIQYLNVAVGRLRTTSLTGARLQDSFQDLCRADPTRRTSLQDKAENAKKINKKKIEDKTVSSPKVKVHRQTDRQTDGHTDRHIDTRLGI